MAIIHAAYSRPLGLALTLVVFDDVHVRTNGHVPSTSLLDVWIDIDVRKVAISWKSSLQEFPQESDATV